MVRRSLDRWGPERGQKLRVFFPHDGPDKVMTATGDVRENTAPGPGEHEFLMRDEAGVPEWVPGWYVATLVGRDV